jgi:glucan 1,3-beta-glucosidase
MSPRAGAGFMDEKRAIYTSPRDKSRRKWIIILGALGLLLLIAAVIIPVYLFVIKRDGNSKDSSNDNKPNGNSSSPGDTDSSDNGAKNRVVTGGDGSEITMEDGTKFTYRNPYGGIWYFDENDPFNNGARAQSFTPALNESFKYGVDQIRGYVIPFFLHAFFIVVMPSYF